jgi:hypothetical protein
MQFKAPPNAFLNAAWMAEKMANKGLVRGAPPSILAIAGYYS